MAGWRRGGGKTRPSVESSGLIVHREIDGRGRGNLRVTFLFPLLGPEPVDEKVGGTVNGKHQNDGQEDRDDVDPSRVPGGVLRQGRKLGAQCLNERIEFAIKKVAPDILAHTVVSN